jgi:hypothetical protein
MTLPTSGPPTRDKGTFADPDRFDIERLAKPRTSAVTGLRISHE